MSDLIETFGESQLQHGRENERVYLMKVSPKDCPAVIDHAIGLATDNGYSKIFSKAPSCCREAFLERKFIEEAAVPAFFGGKEDGAFFSRFMRTERSKERAPETVGKVLAAARGKARPPGTPNPPLEEGMVLRRMTTDDVKGMATLYRDVFKSYPFPIDDPEYLAETMAAHVIYHGIFQDQDLVALASAETDPLGKNVEMTDFATLPGYRGHGLANHLLAKMEPVVRNLGIKTAYTIARAYSFGMNITFARQGYRFAGTLVNNTQIFGQLESMNVWYKPL